MFSLDRLDVQFAHANFRKENHGDEKKAAAYLKFTLAAPNTLLDSIDKALRPAFFRKPGKGEQQALPIDGNNLVALNLPLLGEQKIATEYEAYEVEIASLLGHIEPLFFADAKVKKIAWLPIEGGSISMSLTVSGPDRRGRRRAAAGRVAPWRSEAVAGAAEGAGRGRHAGPAGRRSGEAGSRTPGREGQAGGVTNPVVRGGVSRSAARRNPSHPGPKRGVWWRVASGIRWRTVRKGAHLPATRGRWRRTRVTGTHFPGQY